ncbi:universal stress protein [Mastigocladopsis repens]|uniref:universal stress protein n=1 Tax=Mastigocladopsis repens TaxID=221287 RepID=UPI0003032B60|nr:universal stress protein [Mastigocladopsis repens]
MNLKPILVRLQNAIGRDDLIEQMVLMSAPKTSLSLQTQSTNSVNLIVGYNSSPNSHTALDIALLIAHQTRLATKAQVTVQVVYVIEENQSSHGGDVLQTEEFASMRATEQIPPHCPTSFPLRGFDTGVITQTKLQANAAYQQEILVDRFAQAECILRQASCLAVEWKSSFKAHLRFGCIAKELRKVVAAEGADLLLLGCNSLKHPIVQQLGSNFPCSVLGIPNFINDKRP